jgi:hypothetical protein
MQAGVTARCHIADPLEVPRKVALIGKPDSRSHLGGADTRSQQGASVLDPQPHLVRVRRQTGVPCECAQEVKAAQLRHRCKLFETDRLVEVSIEMMPYALERAPSPRIACRAWRTGARGFPSNHLSASRRALEPHVRLGGQSVPSHNEVLTNHDYECR